MSDMSMINGNADLEDKVKRLFSLYELWKIDYRTVKKTVDILHCKKAVDVPHW